MKATRFSSIGMNTFLIQMDSCNDGERRGTISGSRLAEPIRFSNLARMILLLDELMDLEPSPMPHKPSVGKSSANLELEILFRQNYSWQGKLRWLDGGQEATFHSVLELIFLIESIFS